MIKLNLPTYQYTLKRDKGNVYILDEIRRKYIKLTPEEQVRQNFVKFLINEKKWPSGLLAIEKQITINKNIFRCDIVCYNNKLEAKLIVECKAPNVQITETTFTQAIDYYYKLKPKYIAVTNGLSHYYVEFTEDGKSYKFIKDLPAYK